MKAKKLIAAGIAASMSLLTLLQDAEQPEILAIPEETPPKKIPSRKIQPKRYRRRRYRLCIFPEF